MDIDRNQSDVESATLSHVVQSWRLLDVAVRHGTFSKRCAAGGRRP